MLGEMQYDCLPGQCTGYDFGGGVVTGFGAPGGVGWAVRGLDPFGGYMPREAVGGSGQRTVNSDVPPVQIAGSGQTAGTTTMQAQSQSQSQSPSFLVPALIIIAAIALSR